MKLQETKVTDVQGLATNEKPSNDSKKRVKGISHLREGVQMIWQQLLPVVFRGNMLSQHLHGCNYSNPLFLG